MKYIEFGIGNRWLVRTEIELPDGTEFEQKGIVKPLQPQSFYVRAWIGKTVLIADTKEGLKKRKKSSRFQTIIRNWEPLTKGPVTLKD